MSIEESEPMNVSTERPDARVENAIALGTALPDLRKLKNRRVRSNSPRILLVFF